MEVRERRRDGNKTSTISVCDNMKAGGAACCENMAYHSLVPPNHLKGLKITA